MAVRASDIQVIRAGGSDDMGDVTDRTSPARFTLDADRFMLVFVRVTTERIDGGAPGSDENNLTIKVDNQDGAQFDYTVKVLKDVGPTTNASMSMRVTDEEQSQYVYRRGDVIVCEWTNPDATAIRWGLEVGLADAASVF
jgi:hypothetical protein